MQLIYLFKNVQKGEIYTYEKVSFGYTGSEHYKGSWNFSQCQQIYIDTSCIEISLLEAKKSIPNIEERLSKIYGKYQINKSFMGTKIIAGFPATGKTHAYSNGTKCLDSDSSHFSWVKDQDGKNTKERNPNFPQNYIEHIKENIGKADIIFVSSDDVVRDALVAAGIDFTLAYPDISLKENFVERFKQRGSPQPFIDLVNSNWGKWITECENQKGCDKIVLLEGEYLSDVL